MTELPFPKLRANRAIAEQWAAELVLRNQRGSTKHRFASPLGVLDDLERKRSLPPLPWPASWPRLAARARCYPGDSIAIIGPQGGGKTSFAIQLCRAAMGDGIPCLWCALELDETQIALRLVANMHGVHTHVIRETWSREQIAHALAAVDDLWRFVDRYSDPDLQLNALRDAITLAKKIFRRTPLVVIDYLGKMASLARDIRLATIYAAEQLRALGVSEECFVAMLAQPSRSSSALLTGRAEIDAATDAIGVAGESSEVEAAARVVLGLSVFKADDSAELDAHVLASKTNTGLEGREGFRFCKAGGQWQELDYLPATPSRVKADVEADKRDRHRRTPPRTIVQVRADLNEAAAGSVAAQRRATVLEAITRAGVAGAAETELRAAGRVASVRRVLAELAGADLIERAGERWRIKPRGTR
jgi:KaiC/GvpD/RAD55 family RecA-like ATPase